MDSSQVQISFHALSGHLAPETLHLMGRISNQNVVILIDGGSTHNFVQAHLVRSLGLNTQPTHPLRVMVGNGNEVECYQLCVGVVVHMQGHVFPIDLHVLLLCGADLVLGIQWLKSLDLVPTDYIDLMMKFMHVGQIIEPKGNNDIGLHLITPPQL